MVGAEEWEKGPGTSDYWLTEVSGIPFGLMGEMLQDGGHPYRGMLYGMTARSSMVRARTLRRSTRKERSPTVCLVPDSLSRVRHDRHTGAVVHRTGPTGFHIGASRDGSR